MISCVIPAVVARPIHCGIALDRVAQLHRLRQHPLDTAGEVDRFLVDALSRDQHRELVTAEPRNEILIFLDESSPQLRQATKCWQCWPNQVRWPRWRAT